MPMAPWASSTTCAACPPLFLLTGGGHPADLDPGEMNRITLVED
ncbi:MAG: hypothetical protein R2911_20790 [Caldilineaceae bacterium]